MGCWANAVVVGKWNDGLTMFDSKGLDFSTVVEAAGTEELSKVGGFHVSDG